MCFILGRGITSITIEYDNSMFVAVMYILHCTSLAVSWRKLELNSSLVNYPHLSQTPSREGSGSMLCLCEGASSLLPL